MKYLCGSTDETHTSQKNVIIFFLPKVERSLLETDDEA